MNGQDAVKTAATGQGEPRPWEDLRTSGLLWLINSAVFHPRGYALALHWVDGQVVGWCLLGDGTEPWHMPESADPMFAAAVATLAAQLPPTANPAAQP